MTIGERIRIAREQRGLTQAELATLTGLLPAAISHFETGKREPACHNLVRLCKSLRCSADWLLGMNGTHGEKP